jgi:IS5 family transposase
MRQRTFASQVEFKKYGRKSRRELFLDEMELVVPWSGLLALVRPHYAVAGNGRRPVGLEIMLRTYFVQQWFNLSDPGVEEALYEPSVLQRFVGVDLGAAPAPDATTICRFRHLLEKHDLCGMMLDAVNIHLEAKGIKIATGTIHCSKTRMPLSSMRLLQPRTPAVTTAANVADCRVLPDLLHGEERKVWGDGGYQGQTEAIKEVAPKAQDMTCKRTRYKNRVDELQRVKNRSKSSVRAKVEHPFRILKRIFGFDKVRYRGLAKNHHRLCACFALVNLYLHRKRLVVLVQKCG